MPRLPRPRRPKLPSAGRLRERLRFRGRSESTETKPAASIAARVGAALRGIRYTVGDAAYVVGRGLAAAWRALLAVAGAVGGAWQGLSIHARRRIAALAATLAAAALVWFALLPNLPCQFPAGDRCPPEDDAAKIVPGDALAYAHANVDPETDQYAAAAAIAARLPTLAGQLRSLIPGPSGAPLDFEAQVRPWLGGEVALAFVPGKGGEAESVELFEIAVAEGADAFAQSVASGPLTPSEHAGVTISTDQRGTASAVVGDFLVIGSEPAVKSTVDVSSGERRALSDSPLAQQVLEELPEDSVAEVAVSEDGVSRLLADPKGSLGSLDAFVNFDASVGAGAALVAEGGAMEVAIHSQLDAERLERSPGFFEAFTPFDPALTDDLSAATLAYLGIGDPAASIEDLFTQAIAEAPGIATGLDGLIDELARSGKLDVQSELLPLLEGEAAISIQPSAGKRSERRQTAPGVVPPTGVPYLLFLADEVDEEGAREALAKLQGPVAEALDPADQLQAPVFEDDEIDGVAVSRLRLSRTVDLTYALIDGLLVVATDPDGVARVASGEGGLSSSVRFERATEGLPAEPALLTYLDLSELLALAEREGLSEDPAYALFASDIRRLLALGLAVERGATTLDTTIRVPVDG